MKKHIWLWGILLFTLFFVATSVLFRIYNVEILPSQFYGALIGVVITAIITVLLLQGQSAQEMKRDKDVKIFEQKIRVYSEFTERMWGMFDDEEIKVEELRELRAICFRKLVFYLDKKQLEDIAQEIPKFSSSIESAKRAAESLTRILQDNLHNQISEESSKGDLQKLFNSFEKAIVVEEKTVDIVEAEQILSPTESQFQYWHFNMLEPSTQISAFKKNNWVLSLIEYGEDWRTNLIKQVKSNDIVFLYQKGANGYVGAFRVLHPPNKILDSDSNRQNLYSSEEIEKFDIYEGLDDGASLCSNILVEPIAYNYKGVGYYTVRRRTIERINDIEAVKFLMNRFKGNDIDANQLLGKDKIDANTTISINQNYFSDILAKLNL